MNIRELIEGSTAIPVLTVTDVAAGVALCRALFAGGLTVLEVTLRTPQALDAVSAIARALPDAVVGVGTLTRVEEFQRARDAGARFAVSPGLTQRLAVAGAESGMPYLPSAVTASEVMAAREWGFDTLKFFPCKTAGGAAALKSLAPVFPDVAFCPTGGLTAEDFRDYLALANVVCVGGTWMTPAKLVEARDWPAIEALARATVSQG
ncbi:MAG: bifunctional 4-hydroxy-2-oxoglutarate aldolase/2-dehydro-3-deoxy-phosphogluconate aldolase [Proteobacteria bacterium]|nr:bifunctional 4-hydroxy-2-oxoglutarate aldolase/2-dehydro-3-deoxy-phosphogluconate aldolase [Pseudomonadota bacterium]MBI3496047.1 bifunctional 4-hydroxy-2-oxoglutarate aldolase/2-dehydro-3-deoxy-phosphogluconate aldolase [Pseudomonadota bacterium]